ncbi:MAG: hypothetical protein HRU35_07165, partial [Rickettsiaceae bacterium]|nr:hypothetical protein [Rickettsiaceae bacterium]
LAISYRDLAYNFWSEGFNNAGNIAASMAIKHGLAKTELRSSFSVAFEAKLKKLKRIWLDFIYPIAEKMPASLRQAIKSILIKIHIVKK